MYHFRILLRFSRHFPANTAQISEGQVDRCAQSSAPALFRLRVSSSPICASAFDRAFCNSSSVWALYLHCLAGLAVPDQEGHPEQVKRVEVASELRSHYEAPRDQHLHVQLFGLLRLLDDAADSGFPQMRTRVSSNPRNSQRPHSVHHRLLCLTARFVPYVLGPDLVRPQSKANPIAVARGTHLRSGRCTQAKSFGQEQCSHLTVRAREDQPT